jgi:glycosyltransferase involved in cell wall biosynthesis
MGLLQPDPQILWNRSAFQVASRVLRETPAAAIFVTGPPFSSFLLGCKLKKKFDLPLVLDFRDEWGLVNRHLENHCTGRWSGWRQSRMRRHALRCADAVIATTTRSAYQLQQECLQVGARAHVECIYNGFDSEDLPARNQEVQCGEGAAKLRIVYTGTLWNLTDIGPLVVALRRMEARAPMELHVAGRRTDVQQALLSELDAAQVTVRTYDYLPHQAALRLASTADVLLLTLSDAPGAERVVPAKLFEYMALQKEILAIVPDGETREILAKYPRVGIFHPRSIVEIADWLSNALQRQRTAQSSVLVPLETLREYSRPAQAEQLSEILQGISADYSA